SGPAGDECQSRLFPVIERNAAARGEIPALYDKRCRHNRLYIPAKYGAVGICSRLRMAKSENWQPWRMRLRLRTAYSPGITRCSYKIPAAISLFNPVFAASDFPTESSFLRRLVL